MKTISEHLSIIGIKVTLIKIIIGLLAFIWIVFVQIVCFREFFQHEFAKNPVSVFIVKSFQHLF